MTGFEPATPSSRRTKCAGAVLQVYDSLGNDILRLEVAMVITEDKKAVYILAIFAQDFAYTDDVEIFPKILVLSINA
ncbi:MAG: hypothetical protein KME30_04770 [Iphinoe sp. HA4291-MV1]|jgi:hypothetical protein|nr:hypothetical protein [Iphinoe sp. HA4291-MV1]